MLPASQTTLSTGEKTYGWAEFPENPSSGVGKLPSQVADTPTLNNPKSPYVYNELKISTLIVFESVLSWAQPGFRIGKKATHKAVCDP